MPGQSSHDPLFSDEAFALVTFEAFIQDLDRDCSIQCGLNTTVDDAEASATNFQRVVEAFGFELGDD